MQRLVTFGFPLLALGAALPAGGQTVLHERQLEAVGGERLAALGDLDGDGFGDYGYGIDDPVAGARLVSGRHGGLIAALATGGRGLEIAPAGDANGDGHVDVAVKVLGVPGLAIRVFSGGGAVGPAILDIAPPAGASTGPSGFGAAIASPGDATGDGLADLVVGAPADDRAFLLSGGAVIRTFAPSSPGFQFGIDVAGLADDADGDGVDDLVVSSLREVALFSAATGQPRWTVTASSAADEFGRSIASMNNLMVDGTPFDGTRDVLVGAPGLNQNPGRAFVFSGKTGAAIKDFGGGFGERFGFAVASAGLGANGLPQIVVGAPGAAGGLGAVWLIDAATSNGGAIVFGSTPNAGFGTTVAAPGDVNGDAAPDLIASEPAKLSAGQPAAVVRAMSSRPLALAADRVEISLSQGGTQALHCDGLPIVGQFWQPISDVLGGRPYFLLGSASGILPGFTFKGHHFPLVADAYTSFTAANPFGPFLLPGFGHLDDFGQADSVFAVPPTAAPALIGLVLDHAYVLFDDAALTKVLGISNAVPVRFTP